MKEPTIPVDQSQTDYPLSLSDHLEELRRRLIICLTLVVVCSAVSFLKSKVILTWLKQWISRQVSFELLAFSPAETFLALIKISFFLGLLLSSPIVLYHIWRFVLPALTKREKGVLRIVVPLSLVLFLTGAFFALTVMVPVSLKVLLEIAGDSVLSQLSVGRFVSYVGFCVFLLALVFQLPLVLVVLKKVGRLQAEPLRRNRKYVVLMIFILAAAFTPPDPITQLLMAIPLLVLFELSVFLMKIF